MKTLYLMTKIPITTLQHVISPTSILPTLTTTIVMLTRVIAFPTITVHRILKVETPIPPMNAHPPTLHTKAMMATIATTPTSLIVNCLIVVFDCKSPTDPDVFQRLASILCYRYIIIFCLIAYLHYYFFTSYPLFDRGIKHGRVVYCRYTAVL